MSEIQDSKNCEYNVEDLKIHFFHPLLDWMHATRRYNLSCTSDVCSFLSWRLYSSLHSLSALYFCSLLHFVFLIIFLLIKIYIFADDTFIFCEWDPIVIFHLCSFLFLFQNTYGL